MSPAVRSVLVFAALVVIAAGMRAAGDLMVPFLLSVFIATIAAPPVFWMEQRRVPAPLAITVVMVGIIGVLLGIAALIAQSGTEFSAKLPFYQNRVAEIVVDLVAWLRGLGVELSADLLLSYFNPGTALVMAGNLLRGLGGVLGDGFLILLTVIFILAEASSIPTKLRAVLSDPARDMRHFTQFARNMNRYIVIKTSVSLVTGVLVSALLVIVGVDFPILWGLLAFLLNYVPNIGSIIAAVPAVLLALIGLGPGAALIAAGGYVAVNIVMGNVVEPRFMGAGLGLSTLVVFLSLILWGWLLGPVGMFLSVPLTMTAKIALESNPATAWLAYLLGPADAPRAPVEPVPATAGVDENRTTG
jgi:predicted PurR-regulated permease PerM